MWVEFVVNCLFASLNVILFILMLRCNRFISEFKLRRGVFEYLTFNKIVDVQNGLFDFARKFLMEFPNFVHEKFCNLRILSIRF